MGVDIYMRWKGFGNEDMDNPNYKRQIIGYKDVGKFGYLRISYSNPDYDTLIKPLFWDWAKDKRFNKKTIKKFEELSKEIPKKLQYKKKEWLDFAEFGRKLNDEGKLPYISISY